MTQNAYEDLEHSAKKKSKMEEQLRTSLEQQLLKSLAQARVSIAVRPSQDDDDKVRELLLEKQAEVCV